MTDTAYTLTVDSVDYASFVSEEDAVREAAVNADIASTLDFTTDAGKLALIRVTRFIESQQPNFPEGMGDIAVTIGLPFIARTNVSVAVVREAMARSVQDARPIDIKSSITAGDEVIEFEISGRSLVAGASARGFYDQQAYNLLSLYLGAVEAAPRGITLASAQPNTVNNPPTFDNYRG